MLGAYDGIGRHNRIAGGIGAFILIGVFLYLMLSQEISYILGVGVIIFLVVMLIIMIRTRKS